MNASMMLLLATLPMLGGCQGAIFGNLMMLALSVGIFMGTLSLSKHR